MGVVTVATSRGTHSPTVEMISGVTVVSQLSNKVVNKKLRLRSGVHTPSLIIQVVLRLNIMYECVCRIFLNGIP